MEVVKRTGFFERVFNVELRIGGVAYNSGTGYVLLDGNPLVGYYEGPDSNAAVIFQLASSVSGRYVSIQTSELTYFDVDEIYVYVFG